MATKQEKQHALDMLRMYCPQSQEITGKFCHVNAMGTQRVYTFLVPYQYPESQKTTIVCLDRYLHTALGYRLSESRSHGDGLFTGFSGGDEIVMHLSQELYGSPYVLKYYRHG